MQNPPSLDNQEIVISAVPIIVNYTPRPVESVEFLGSQGLRQNPASVPALAPRAVSAVALRERFLGLVGFEQVASFLKDCGPFFASHLPQVVTLEGVSLWQMILREWMETRDLNVEKLHELHVLASTTPGSLGVSLAELDAFRMFVQELGNKLTFDPEIKALKVNTSSALESMAAATYAEFMAGRKFRRCALPSCQNVFAVSNSGRRERLYCSPVHSSQAAVYRGREKAKGKTAK